jgi:RES domain-containing protein
MRYVVATIPHGVSRAVLDLDALPDLDRPDHRASRALGDAWYDAAAAAVLVVPSVLSPFEPNVLINQDHPDTGRIEVSAERLVELDRRLRSQALAGRGGRSAGHGARRATASARRPAGT